MKQHNNNYTIHINTNCSALDPKKFAFIQETETEQQIYSRDRNRTTNHSERFSESINQSSHVLTWSWWEPKVGNESSSFGPGSRYVL